MPFDAVLQTAAVVGTYGLGILTVLAFAAPALLGDHTTRSLRHGFTTLSVAWGVLAIAAALGAGRLATADLTMADAPRIRIVQPNIPQIDKWKQDKRDDNLLRHVELSRQDGFAELDAVIWPETAAPFAINLDHERRRFAAMPLHRAACC